MAAQCTTGTGRPAAHWLMSTGCTPMVLASRAAWPRSVWMKAASDMGAHHSASLCVVNSEPLHHSAVLDASNGRMKLIAEIRRCRLGQIKDETGLSWAEISRQLGRTSRDSTLSQIWHRAPDSKTGRPRSMGDDQARALEQAFKKPEGWMDRDPDIDALEAQLAASRGLQAGEPAAIYGLPGITADDLAELDDQRRTEVAQYVRERLALQRLERQARAVQHAAEPMNSKRAAA